MNGIVPGSQTPKRGQAEKSPPWVATYRTSQSALLFMWHDGLKAPDCLDASAPSPVLVADLRLILA